MGEESTGIEPSRELDAESESVMKNKNEKSGLYGVLVILIVLILAGVGSFFLYQLRSNQEGLGGELDKDDRQISRLNDQLATFQNQMSTLQSQTAAMQTTLSTKEAKFERALAEFKEHHGNKLESTKADLSGSISEIHTLLNRTRGDWMVADAEYLLSVANQRLKLVGDVKTSLVALRAADERLRDSGNPGVFKVREQLASEISALKQLKPVDIVGVFARIRVLQDQVMELPVFLPHSGKVGEQTDQQEPVGEAENISGVDDFLDSAIDDLKGLVVVRRTDRKVDAVLQPEEVRIIREELKIKLEIVRLALLERDSKLFLQSLGDAKAWLKAHFRLDAPESKKFSAELEGLNKIGLEIDYPDISGSLNLLQNLASLRVETDKSAPAKLAPSVVKPAAKKDQDQKQKGAQQ